VRYGLGFASAAAGILHLTAAPAHGAHDEILAFFIASGTAQIAFGAFVLAPAPPRSMLRAAAAGNAALVAVWAASRMTGLPFVEGAGHAEPVGVKDTVTVLFELIAVATAIALLTGGDALRARIRPGDRASLPLAAATALLVIPGLLTPAHRHEDDHAHAGAGHSHTSLAAGAEHEHVGAGSDHEHEDGDGHQSPQATHGHAAGAAADHAHGGEAGHATHRAVPTGDPSNPPRPEGIRVGVRYGPFFLPPAEMGGTAHYNRILGNVPKPCTDCYVVRMKPNLVYADGSTANLDTGAMLHHAVWTRPNVPDSTCNRDSAIGSLGMRFFASGNERTEMVLPEGFGYHVGTDPWYLVAEVMNHGDRPRTVYITLDVVYRKERLRPVTPVWMDIDNCADSEYAVPSGPSNRLWTWRSTLTGRVVATAGHVHDGGIKTVLTNQTRNHEMCSSYAGYGTRPEFRGSVESMSMCVWDRIGVVREGEILGLRAYYHTPAPRDDVMGINIAYIFETDDLDGGTPAPRVPAREQAPPQGGGHDHP
jgi:hypothetical protein